MYPVQGYSAICMYHFRHKSQPGAVTQCDSVRTGQNRTMQSFQRSLSIKSLHVTTMHYRYFDHLAKQISFTC